MPSLAHNRATKNCRQPVPCMQPGMITTMGQTTRVPTTPCGQHPNRPSCSSLTSRQTQPYGPEMASTTFTTMAQRAAACRFILLDTRFFRSPLKRGLPTLTCPRVRYLPNDDPEAALLGEEQWTWLEQQLKQPAQLRVLASSIQVTRTSRARARAPIRCAAALDRLIAVRSRCAPPFIDGDPPRGLSVRTTP
jgi:hypothetical protein